MTDVSQVGPLTLPVPTGGQDTALQDETLVGLLECLGFWLKTNLDAKFAEMRGPTTSAPITDACPAAHRFPWFHNDSFTRPLPAEAVLAASENRQAVEPLPALYAWEEGSEFLSGTLYWDFLKRTIKVQYIFPELQIPWGYNGRHGLVYAVERTFAKAAERFMRHDSYGYGSSADGVPLARSLNVTNIRMVSGQPGMLSQVPGNSTSTGRGAASGTIQRSYPAYLATFLVWEKIDQRDDADVAGDSLGTIAVDTESDGLDVIQIVTTPGIAE